MYIFLSWSGMGQEIRFNIKLNRNAVHIILGYLFRIISNNLTKISFKFNIEM